MKAEHTNLFFLFLSFGAWLWIWIFNLPNVTTTGVESIDVLLNYLPLAKVWILATNLIYMCVRVFDLSKDYTT